MPMGDGPNDAGLSRHHLIRRLRGEPAPPGHRLHRPLPGARVGRRRRRSRRRCGALDDLVQLGQGPLRRLLQLRRLAPDEGARASRSGAGYQRFVTQQIHYSLQARDAEYELVPSRSTRASASSSGARSPAACCRASTAAASRARRARATSRTGASRRSATRTSSTTSSTRWSRSPRSHGGLAGAGRARLAARPPGRRLGRHRRAHRRAARRQPRRGRPACSATRSAHASTS